MPRVMLLIPSTTYRAPDFIEAAQHLDVEIVVGSDQGSPLQDLTEGRSLVVNLMEPEIGARQIEAFALLNPIDTIVAVDDAGALVAAAASEMLGIAHNSFDAVEATRNKHLLRRRLTQGELLSPDYRVVPVDSDPATVAAELAAQDGFP